MARLLKVCIMTTLLSMLLIPFIAQAATNVTTEAKILLSVSFRSQPATTGAFIRYLQKNEIVTVLSKANAYWYTIKDAHGKLGYVSTADKYITITSNARIVAGVDFKSQPTTTSTRIRMLQVDEKMLVLEKVNASWYRAEDMNGVEGYVSIGTNYITTDFSVTGLILPLQDQIELVIQAGMHYLGTPYQFGSSRSNTSSFDCSDFVRQAFLDGLNDLLPGDSRGQGNLVKQLGTAVYQISELKRGDLIFFISYAGSKAANYTSINKSSEPITHVGIYLGNGQVLHTYSVTSGGVRVDNLLGTTWEYRFLYGGSAMS